MPLHGIIYDENLSIALLRIYHLLDPSWYAVLRCIDSSRSVSDLVNILRSHDIAHRVINGNVCMTLVTINKAIADGLFHGFDEIWVISGTPPCIELSKYPCATSDGIDFSHEFPEGFAEVMRQVSCVIVLGDGCGLNYATNRSDIHQELLKRA